MKRAAELQTKQRLSVSVVRINVSNNKEKYLVWYEVVPAGIFFTDVRRVLVVILVLVATGALRCFFTRREAFSTDGKSILLCMFF